MGFAAGIPVQRLSTRGLMLRLVIASEAKQSPRNGFAVVARGHKGRLDCFVARAPRNGDGDGLTQTASSAKACSPKRHRGKPSMKKFIRTSTDLGKSYFKVHALE